MLFGKLFQKNINLKRIKNVPLSNKMWISYWPNACTASIYSTLELDARPILKKLTDLKTKNIINSMSAIIGKAAAIAIKEYPKINSIIRFGRIYQRKEINISFAVACGKHRDDVFSILLRDCDQMPIETMGTELRRLTLSLRRGIDPDARIKSFLNRLLPGIVIPYFVKLLSFILYKLNWYLPLIKEKDVFGSASISAVGIYGIEQAFSPLIPIAHCPVAILIGSITDKVKAENGKVVIVPTVQLGITLDHRLITGADAAKLMKAFKKYLANPY